MKNQGREALDLVFAQLSDVSLARGSRGDKWRLLQRAHRLSQPHWRYHTYVHFLMACFAFQTVQILEAFIQIFFILGAGPSSIFKFFPPGHPGTMTIDA